MLSALYALLREKEEQLGRLKSFLTKITICQTEFTANKKIITEPLLSSNTWQGNLAEKFSDIRIKGMSDCYTEIETTQLNEVISLTEAKIVEIEAEIESIRAQIAALEEQERQAALQKKGV